MDISYYFLSLIFHTWTYPWISISTAPLMLPGETDVVCAKWSVRPPERPYCVSADVPSKAEHSQVQEDLAKTNAQMKEVTGVLDQLQTLIYDTFVRLGCSQKTLEDMLGLNVPINTNNMIVYLGQIEQRANELLNILHCVSLKVRQYKPALTRVQRPTPARF